MNLLQAGFRCGNTAPAVGTEDTVDFPMQDSYDEGGYEARSSRFKAGTAEIIIKESVALLDSLR